MAGIAGLSTMTARFPATADDSGDRSGAKIAQSRKLGGQQRTLLFQFRERLWHGDHLCTYYIRSERGYKKRRPANCHSEVAHPRKDCPLTPPHAGVTVFSLAAESERAAPAVSLHRCAWGGSFRLACCLLGSLCCDEEIFSKRFRPCRRFRLS